MDPDLRADFMADIASNLKFFPHDVISGKFAKIGDKFTAEFFGAKSKFQVTEVHSGFVIARKISDPH